ncbi:MAG: hypothetical protein WBW33_13730 [Bryobacteraceae bacterium]
MAFLVGAVPLAARAARASPKSAAGPPQQAVVNPASADARVKAQDDVRKNSDRLRQIELATDMEPAFVFHP